MNKYSDVEIDFSLLQEKPLDLMKILMKYLSHWKWFVLSIAVSCTIAALYVLYAVPTYKVETSILFKDDMRGGVSELNVLKEMGLVTQRSNVDNEVEVLKKSLIIEQVVRDMELYVDYSEKRTFGFLKDNVLGSVLPGFIKRKKVVLYGDESPLLVRVPDEMANGIAGSLVFEITIDESGNYKISGKHAGSRFHVQVKQSDSVAVLPFGNIKLLRTNYLRGDNEEITINVAISNPAEVAIGYQRAMQIDLTSKTSSVANISLVCTNGNLGKDFLKNYIETYNEKGISDQIKLADKTSKVIEEHLAQLSGELSSVESQAQIYKQSKGLTNIASQADIYNSQSANVRQRQNDIETQLSIVSSINNHVQSIGDHTQLIPSSSGITSPLLNEEIESYNKLVLERNKLSRIASSSNQSMIDLNKRIESTFNSLKSGLQNERNNLQIQLGDVSSMLSQNYARLRAIPQQEREYSDILRQQNVKEALFVYLLQKKEEKYMNMASVTPSSKLIDNIYVKGLASPNIMVIGIIFLALGLIVPFLVIAIRDLLRYQIYTKEEIEELSSIPILGQLPKVEDTGSVLVQENKNDTFNEMMRLIRANLLFVSSNQERVINVLSSISGEGKTLTSINLAHSIALLDKRVLMIELDIRKPKLTGLLNINNEKGITLFLSGQLDKKELIVPSGINPNLFVIPSGPIPPNPNELLAKGELDMLIQELRSQFDYIIIDTSPIGVVSDSFLLNRIADINIYIVRSGITPKSYIEDADDYHKEKKLKRTYFILNSVDLSKAGYGYGYGKKYSYGYG